MEAKQSRSAKRKTPSFSANPFLGTFTRSKSQIFVHRSRSGRRRPDSVHRSNPLSKIEPSEPPERRNRPDLASGDLSDIGDGTRILIKDLRVRRVFSPSGGAQISKVGVQIGDGFFRKSRKVSGINPNLSSIGENTDAGIGLDGKKVGKVRVSDQFGLEISGEDKDFDSNGVGDGKIPDGVGNRSEEDDCKLHKDGCNFQVVGSVPVNPINGGVKKSEGLVLEVLKTQSDKGNGSISKNKSALKQRSRSKLFKPADSFSYRRLLPYLMDMTSDNTSSLPGDHSIGQSLTHNKVLEDNLVHQSLATSKHEMLFSTCNPSNSGSDGLRDGSEENSTPMEIITESLSPSGPTVCSLASADDDGCVKTPTNGAIESFDREPHFVTGTKNTENCDIQQEGDDESKKEVLDEELVQFTPPDATIGDKTIVDASESSRVDCGLRSSESPLEKLSSGNISRHNNLLNDKRNQSSFKSQSVLKQCTRMKLFKSPGSFSYRRLLPYLMDVAKEKSCASGNNQFPKINGCLEENPPQQSTVPACKTIPTDDSGSNTVLRATFTAASGSTNNSELNVTSPENIKVSSPVSFNLEEALSTVADVKSDADTKLETVTNTSLSICENGPSVALSLLVSNGSSSGEGQNSLTEHSSVTTVGGSNSSSPAEATSMLQNSSCLEMTVPLKNSPLASLKGILKRNPRGCRGLCTCLHCSSFRLNAEKAFEFSRNQMQETEELTLDLINQIANLRNILEKCGGSADILVNQVKEACRKASESEEAAKQLLDQMNDDLNIHSRMRCSQPPRVRFANWTEENAIP